MFSGKEEITEKNPAFGRLVFKSLFVSLTIWVFLPFFSLYPIVFANSTSGPPSLNFNFSDTDFSDPTAGSPSGPPSLNFVPNDSDFEDFSTGSVSSDTTATTTTGSNSTNQAPSNSAQQPILQNQTGSTDIARRSSGSSRSGNDFENLPPRLPQNLLGDFSSSTPPDFPQNLIPVNSSNSASDPLRQNFLAFADNNLKMITHNTPPRRTSATGSPILAYLLLPLAVVSLRKFSKKF